MTSAFGVEHGEFAKNSKETAALGFIKSSRLGYHFASKGDIPKAQRAFKTAKQAKARLNTYGRTPRKAIP